MMVRLVSQFIFAVMCLLMTSSAMANVLTSASASPSASPLQLSVNAGLTTGTVDVSLTNTGAESVSVLLWNTPFESTLSDNVFLVEKAVKGFPLLQVAEFVGRSVKRSNPTADSYQTLRAGETITANVILNKYYDITQLGEHTVRFVGGFNYEVLSTQTLRSKQETVSIDQLDFVELLSERAAINLFPSLTPRLRTPSYESCSAQQRVDILEASSVAEALIDTAISDLAGLTVNERATSPRYGTWFGAYTNTRFNRVVENFNAIDRALENQSLQFNCDCSESSVFAFVFPAFPYSITLCPRFWQVNTSGEDSKAGTIIHELSHFHVVASTDDHVYGHTGARSLAVINPNIAIVNADSYEYFAENTPALSIRDSAAVERPTTFVTLPLGVQSSGNIAKGSSDLYELTNATRIELESISGDADLYIYEDDQLTREMCASANGSDTIDYCEIYVNGTVYVEVRGFSDANFVVRADAAVAVNDSEVEELTLEVPVIRSVGANIRDYYRVNGGDVIELQSVSGDADLYVFNSLDLTSESLVCISNRSPEELITDTCNIPSNEIDYYVLVVGYIASDYTLVARSASPLNAIRLIAGETFNGNVSAGSFDYYVVSGVDSVVLTSVTGNADLLVTEDSAYAENESSCTSTELTTDSVSDSCVVSNTNDHYILVRGFSDATYSILGSSASTEPEAGDDPSTQTIFIGTARSGGASGALSLALLLLSFGFRDIRKD